MATEYRCPVDGCLWSHVDRAELPVPSWEPWSRRRHSFTLVSMDRELLRIHHIDVEKVLYAHLETHSPAQWMETLRRVRSEDGVPVG